LYKYMTFKLRSLTKISSTVSKSEPYSLISWPSMTVEKSG